MATDSGPRTLSQPAASPDGRRLVVVAAPFSAAPGFTGTFGGARLLRHGVREPTWGAR